MAKISNTLSYSQIIKDIQGKKFAPVYLLYGEEAYYIDRIAEAIVDNALAPDERDFGLLTLYGADTDISNVISAAQSFPMGSQYQVVVVKDAQSLKGLDKLSYYLKALQPSTVLVITYRKKDLDKSLPVAQINSVGVVFNSPLVRDNALPALVTEYLGDRGYRIGYKAVQMVCESIGTDLARLFGELDKLIISMAEGTTEVTPDDVERNIGISKDYNIFELQNAIGSKNVKKCFLITKIYAQNPKQHPLPVILPSLFNYFSNALTAFYCPRPASGREGDWVAAIASALKMQDWQVRNNIMPVIRNYTAKKMLDIMGEIRAADEKCKGFGGSRLSEADIFTQLMAYILG